MPSTRLLYQRSILFEIVNVKNPGEIVSAFTLCIPPESYENVQSQRVSRTNTFGGLFIDDYGPGVAKITISGTTGNQEMRATYIPGGGGSLERYTGKSALFALRNKIGRYKALLSGRGYENYEMRMYDLSTVPDMDNLDTIKDAATDAWLVSLDDFKISRSKEKPLWYSYSIELVGIAPLPSVRKKKGDLMGSFFSSTGEFSIESLEAEINASLAPILVPLEKVFLQDIVGALTRGITTVRNTYSWSQDTLASINDVFSTIADLEVDLVEYINSAENLIDLGSDTLHKIFEVAKFPGALAKTALFQVVSTMNSVEVEMAATPEVAEIMGDNYDYTMQLCEEVKRAAARIVVFGKSQKADSEITVNVAGRNFSIYGTRSTTASGGTTLERLAAENYGDPSLALLIGIFNGITNDDISVGDTIRIPLVVRVARADDNKIFSWDKQSNYGADIRLSSSPARIVVAESGDFSVIDGEDNLLQAINMRLNETLGKRLRLTVYGLSNSFGSSRNNSAPVGYIMTNLKDTLRQDPRIKSIDAIKLLGAGDNLKIAFNAQAIEDLVQFEGGI